MMCYDTHFVHLNKCYIVEIIIMVNRGRRKKEMKRVIRSQKFKQHYLYCSRVTGIRSKQEERMTWGGDKDRRRHLNKHKQEYGRTHIMHID